MAPPSDALVALIPTGSLAQQGTFATFAGVYCCAIPLGLALALLLIYFVIRLWTRRSDR